MCGITCPCNLTESGAWEFTVAMTRISNSEATEAANHPGGSQRDCGKAAPRNTIRHLSVRINLSVMELSRFLFG